MKLPIYEDVLHTKVDHVRDRFLHFVWGGAEIFSGCPITLREGSSVMRLLSHGGKAVVKPF